MPSRRKADSLQASEAKVPDALKDDTVTLWLSEATRAVFPM
jgi:hypothetical protein